PGVQEFCEVPCPIPPPPPSTFPLPPVSARTLIGQIPNSSTSVSNITNIRFKNAPPIKLVEDKKRVRYRYRTLRACYQPMLPTCLFISPSESMLCWTEPPPSSVIQPKPSR